MTAVKVEEKKTEDQADSIKKKCARCLKGPNLIRTIIVVACLALLVQQISVSIQKLINIPITTYTHFDFNKTIEYPSVTFCREPPYRYDKMIEYDLYAHPRYTSTWMKFNFSRISLEDLWDEITYEEKDFFVQYGFDGLAANVIMTPSQGFINGRCFTVTPRHLSTRATKASGYSFMLHHSASDVATSTSVLPPGYHVYIHYVKEPYTEVEVYNGGLVEYLYVNTGETVDVKLTVDEYVMISSEDDPCMQMENYSANNCTTRYVWDMVEQEVGCSGPWMNGELPHCNNYTDMRSLISSYLNAYQDHACSVCPRSCHSYLYNAFVTDRQTLYTWDYTRGLWDKRSGDAELQTQLYIHFNSMMVSVYEESYNYDWNLFLADLGGSVGFLLGLSVIGLITILGNVLCTIKPLIITPKKDEDNVSTSNTNHRTNKTSGLDHFNGWSNGLT